MGITQHLKVGSLPSGRT